MKLNFQSMYLEKLAQNNMEKRKRMQHKSLIQGIPEYECMVMIYGTLLTMDTPSLC